MPSPASHPASPTTAAPPTPPWFAPAVFVATGFGIGRVPFAPGTFGSFLGLPLAAAMTVAATALAGRLGTGPTAAWAIEAALVVAVCLASIPICSRAARCLGRKDPGAIVLDEVASLPLALLALAPQTRTPTAIAVAFVVLRVFDITKPPPCRQLEALPAGLGIMADDWGAAAWTAACLAAARWLHWI
jgi:phosphatidylglycerophosphatase A